MQEGVFQEAAFALKRLARRRRPLSLRVGRAVGAFSDDALDGAPFDRVPNGEDDVAARSSLDLRLRDEVHISPDVMEQDALSSGLDGQDDDASAEKRALGRSNGNTHATAVLLESGLEAVSADLGPVVAGADSGEVVCDGGRLIERKTLLSALEAGEGAELLVNSEIR